MPNRAQPHAGTESLPPRIPETNEELDRAIMLVGSCLKQKLSPKRKNELTQLLGSPPPNPKVAAAWKQSLKQLRQWEREDAQSPRRRVIYQYPEQ